jgi:hypothetical protein
MRPDCAAVQAWLYHFWCRSSCVTTDLPRSRPPGCCPRSLQVHTCQCTSDNLSGNAHTEDNGAGRLTPAASIARHLHGLAAIGYVLTQVPGGWFVKRLGAKLVVTTTSTVLGGVLLLLPSAGRAGPWAVCAAFAATGVVQGPYMAAAAVVQATAMPAIDSPASAERPLANMIIRLGQQIAKLLVASVTPVVAGRFGWAMFPRVFGVFVLLCTAGFALVVPASRPVVESRPKQPAGVEKEKEEEEEEEQGDRKTREPPEGKKDPAAADVSILRMVCSLPAQSLIWNQCCHDLMEQHCIGAWCD